MTNLTLMEKVEIADLEKLQNHLMSQTITERVKWALNNLDQSFTLSSSFGAQSAVCLHLISQQYADIPVILIDTGYLFPETYQFIDQLTTRLKLNLKVYNSELSSAWLESRYGQLWNNEIEGIAKFNQITKITPLQKAFKELNIKTWFTGLRNEQSASRKAIKIIEKKATITKFHPIIDMTDRDVFLYLKKNNLPYHPLWGKGYVSIGDVHTSKPVSATLTAEQSRFFGLKRECGIHELDF